MEGCYYANGPGRHTKALLHGEDAGERCYPARLIDDYRNAKSPGDFEPVHGGPNGVALFVTEFDESAKANNLLETLMRADEHELIVQLADQQRIGSQLGIVDFPTC